LKGRKDNKKNKCKKQMDKVKVQTTQNVEINYEIASLGDRVVAALIDYGVLIAYMLTISVIVYFLNQLDIQGDWLLILLMMLCLVIIFYDLLCETLMEGQSIGKKIMKIKVIKLDGTQPSFGSYFMRWMLRIVDVVLFSPAVAMLVILINGKGQRLGDIAAIQPS
jgi:Predicted membrane protein/domain